MDAARRKARDRTRKLRETREAIRRPEARQVDRAVLLALTYWTRAHGSVIDLDRGDLTQILRYAIRVLAWRHDEAEAREAVQDRLQALVESREVDNMLRADRPLRMGPAVTP